MITYACAEPTRPKPRPVPGISRRDPDRFHPLILRLAGLTPGRRYMLTVDIPRNDNIVTNITVLDLGKIEGRE